MASANTLSLTADEKKQFEKLPAELKEGWEVKEETLTSYETDDALRIRMHMARFHKNPAVMAIVEKVKAGEPLDKISLGDIPEDFVPTFFFTIGARGVSVFIGLLLSEVKTDEQIRGLASLTEVRHDILETNAAVSYV